LSNINRDRHRAQLECVPYAEEAAAFLNLHRVTVVRQASVGRLEWSQIDMQRHVAWIHADQAKARKAIAVPLNYDAVAVIRRQIGKHQIRVFYRCGKTGAGREHACTSAGASASGYRQRSLA